MYLSLVSQILICMFVWGFFNQNRKQRSLAGSVRCFHVLINIYSVDVMMEVIFLFLFFLFGKKYVICVLPSHFLPTFTTDVLEQCHLQTS